MPFRTEPTAVQDWSVALSVANGQRQQSNIFSQRYRLSGTLQCLHYKTFALPASIPFGRFDQFLLHIPDLHSCTPLHPAAGASSRLPTYKTLRAACAALPSQPGRDANHQTYLIPAHALKAALVSTYQDTIHHTHYPHTTNTQTHTYTHIATTLLHVQPTELHTAAVS